MKYGKTYLDRQVAEVQQVLATREYRQFADQVLQKEADSLKKLGLDAPHLDIWKQSLEQMNSAEAAGSTVAVGVLPSQHKETKEGTRAETDSDEEQQAIDAMKKQNRKRALQLQKDQEEQIVRELDAKQQALTKRRRLQEEEEEQIARELDAEKQALTKRKIEWEWTQQLAQARPGFTTQLPLADHLQPSKEVLSPPMLLADLLQCSSQMPASSITSRDHKQAAKTEAQLHNPSLFQSSTIEGRYQEWADDGAYKSIKSCLKPAKKGLQLPKTGHTDRASDNLRKNRNLP